MAQLLYLNQFFTTTLSVIGGVDASQTTDFTLQSVSGLDTTKPGIGLLNYSDPLDTSIAEWFEYTAINSTTKTCTGVVRAREGFSAKTHSNGVTIAFPISESHVNRIAEKLNGNDTLDNDLDLGATVNLKVAGSDPKRGIYIDAAAMKARTTSGAASSSTETSTNKVMKSGYAFDKDTDEFVQFKIPAPKYWNLGTITATPHWTADAGTTGTVCFAVQALALSNDDAIDTAFGTEQTSTDTFIATGDEHVGPTTAAITVGDTPAKGDLLVFQVYRDVSADTFDADAILLGLEISFGIGQYNDA